MGLQAEDGTAMAIGVAAFGVSPRDNAVNLSASEGAMSNLMLRHLLHLSASLVLIPPQLSLPTWTRMRRAKIGYKSLIHFPTAYLPPNISESECNSQQLMLMSSLQVPAPQVLLDLADQLDSLRTGSPQPKGSVPRLGDKDGPKDETPKRKSANTEDTPKKQHTHEKGQSRHYSAEKSPASSTHEPNVNFDASRLGNAVAWACLSVTRITKVVDTHNSKVAEALLTK